MTYIRNMKQPEVISIDGVDYVKKDSIEPAKTLDGLEYKIVRTYSAGVFAGYLESRNGKEVVLRKARRLWYWDGAASLSQLAQSGTTKPKSCKFPEEVDKIELTEAVEILDVTSKAKESIDSVQIWEA